MLLAGMIVASSIPFTSRHGFADGVEVGTLGEVDDSVVTLGAPGVVVGRVPVVVSLQSFSSSQCTRQSHFPSHISLVR